MPESALRAAQQARTGLPVVITSSVTGAKRIIELPDPRLAFCQEYNRAWPGGEWYAAPLDEHQPDS